jgi:hypothetical protein
MKKIYWIINQLNISDSAIYAVEIANKLVQYRSISIIVLGKNNNLSNVSGKIDIIYLDIDDKEIINDKLTSYFKANKLKLKDRISELTTKNDIIISTSYLSSYIVPKGRRFLYYYDKTKDIFLSFKSKLERKKYRNPDNYIFSSIELKKALEKKKKYHGSYQIYPSSILYPALDFKLNNTISYIYNESENYLLPLEIINELKDLKIKLNYYSNLKVNDSILSYIKSNGLTKIVNILEYEDIIDVFKNSDIYINLNKNNALPLNIIDAMSQGRIIISYNNEAVDESMSIIINEKNIVESTNEIKELFIKQKRLEKYKQQSFNLSFRYNKEMVIAKWLDILEIEDNLIHKE